MRPERKDIVWICPTCSYSIDDALFIKLSSMAVCPNCKKSGIIFFKGRRIEKKND